MTCKKHNGIKGTQSQGMCGRQISPAKITLSVFTIKIPSLCIQMIVYKQTVTAIPLQYLQFDIRHSKESVIFRDCEFQLRKRMAFLQTVSHAHTFPASKCVYIYI